MGALSANIILSFCVASLLCGARLLSYLGKPKEKSQILFRFAISKIILTQTNIKSDCTLRFGTKYLKKQTKKKPKNKLLHNMLFVSLVPCREMKNKNQSKVK